MPLSFCKLLLRQLVRPVANNKLHIANKLV
jgi:hypothetical protein